MEVLGGIGDGANGSHEFETVQLAHAARLLQVGSWEWDLSRDQVTWSRELYRIFGMAEEFTPTYEAFVELVHSEDRERVEDLIQSALGLGTPLEFEHRVVRPDGRVRTLHCRGEVVYEGGRPVRLFGICQDVTERKRIQDEIAITRSLALCVDAAVSADEAWAAVLNRLCAYGGFALGHAWTVAEDNSYLEFGSAWLAPASPHGLFTNRSRAMTFEAGAGLPGRALLARQSVWVEDVRSDAGLPRAQFAREAGLAGAMAVPVPSGARTVAVLEFFASEPRVRDDAVADLIARVAAQLGAMLERKHSDDALRTSEERFRLLLESVEESAIVMLDQAGNVASWNHVAEQVTGYREAEVLGCHVSRLYTPEALAAGEPEQHLRQVAAESRMEHSGLLMRADGLHYRADVTITALRNGGPSPKGYSYVIRDLTDRRRTEHELQRLRATTSCTQDAIISVTSARGIVTSWNAGAHRLFGYTEREMVGRPLGLFDAALDLPRLLRDVSADHRSEHHDTQVERKNGGVVEIAMTAAPVPGAAEVTLIARDVTERRRTERYLERMFGTYLDRDIAEHILREGPGLRAREVDVTMMFLDIRGFTTFAEQFRPVEVVETLNCLFELVVPLIAERHGHVDKFVGDGLLAVFGAPQPRSNHADLALDAARAIAQAAHETFRGDLEIGMGIDSGTVIAGNVGGGGRLDFTVIGDAVNTAARIETATRETGDTILFSEATMRRLGGSDLRVVQRPCERMKGKRNAVALYALEAEAPPAAFAGVGP